MRFALMIEPQQGMSYDDQLAIAKRAEAAGFEALLPVRPLRELPGPGRQADDRCLGGARRARARDRRIGLGALVSPVTFRHPGILAKVVTTVDEMSGGRIEVGVGAGWNDVEHRQLGLPSRRSSERADLIEDQLAILHGLWGEPDGWSFDGRRASRSADAQFHPDRWPCPAGRRRRSARRGRGSSSAAAGRRARCGSPRATPTSSTFSRRRPTAPRSARELDDACRAIGRDPATLARSTMAGILIGRSECRGRGARSRRCWPRFGATPMPARRGWTSAASAGSIGTPDQARAQVERFAAAGWSGSCSRTSCPGTSRWSTSWARSWSAGSDASALGGGSAASRVAVAIVAADRVRVRAPGAGDRSVRSWSGVAVPSSAATGAGSAGASGDDDPAGRASARSGRSTAASAATIAAASMPTTRGRREVPGAHARRDRRAASRSREDEDEPGRVIGRRRGGRGGTSRGRGTRPGSRCLPRS